MKRAAVTEPYLSLLASPRDETLDAHLLEENAEAGTSISSLRRSKRLKVRREDALQDLEDIVRPAAPGRPKHSPPSNKTVTVRIRSLGVTTIPPKLAHKAVKEPHPEPVGWRDAYDAIKDMRSRIDAPVDTMGCDMAQLKENDPKNKRFITLVSLMLSSQTKDEVVDAAVAKLQDAVGGTMSVDAIISASPSTVASAINKCGFWPSKTKYIKQAAQDLRDHFDSEVPKTMEELCSIKGIGPKMAFLILQFAWKINVGIGVDTHIHRITNRLRWHQPATTKAEATRYNLESWMPAELWPDINNVLVGFGQTVCRPDVPRCNECVLASKNLCPSAQITAAGSKAKSKSGHIPKVSVKIAIEGLPAVAIM
ncbi:DNA glycosylase [Auriscalpium vulgare]|uniref:DNA glycosylase n=1 Tax=Auriscalpium vulgare TaxID=40419 RepID=A0ACB8RQZ9_9AGAM|nr:DNA glycosylase [Auriscalpium vulgare]